MFRFNLTLMFIQQFLCMITFILVSRTQKFKVKAGEISFSDFLKLKNNYLTFAFIFIMNNLAGFYGNQLIINTPMFLTLRKLILVMLFFYDLIIMKKKINCFTIICIFLVTLGSIIAGIEDFSNDYVGYIVVIVYNSLTVFYNKYTETFRKKTGVSNLKLLVYNSFLSCPVLFAFTFISGEYWKLKTYLGTKPFEGTFNGLVFYLFLSGGFCVNLILGFFVSNEKNSSLFTALLSNCKDIFITIIGYFTLKGNKFTVCIIGGLLMSTVGAVMIGTKTLIDNILSKKKTKEDGFKPVKVKNGSEKQ